MRLSIITTSILPSVKPLIFSSYHITQITTFIFLSSIILPLNIHVLCEEHQASLLGNILALCGIYAGIASLFFGLVVDFFNSKRARFAIVAFFTLLFVLSCFALSFYYETVLLVAEGEPQQTHCSLSSDLSLWVYIILFVNAKGLFSIAHAPYYALIPQLFKDREYGRVSGFVGVGVMLGVLLATGVIASVYQTLWDSVWMILLGVLNLFSLIGLASVIFTEELGWVWKWVNKTLLRIRSASRDEEPLFALNESINVDYNEKSSLLSPGGHTVPQHLGKCEAYEVFLDDSDDKDTFSFTDKNSADSQTTACTSPPSDPPTKTPIVKKLTSPHILIRVVREGVASLLRPWRNRNFVLCFLNRFFFFASISISSSFQLYFIQDVLGANDYQLWFKGLNRFIDSAERALAVTTFVGLITSIITSIGAGYMADKSPDSRLSYVFFGTLIYGGTKALTPLMPDFTYFLLLNLVQGLGLGSWMSTNLALTNQVIKNKKKAGTEFAILSLAQFVPQLIVPVFGGYLLEWGQKLGKDVHFDQLGYWLIYLVSGILSLIASIVMLFFDNAALRESSKAAREAEKAEDDPEIDGIVP